MKKDSFILYNSFYEPIKELNDEQLGKLFRAIFNYTMNGEITKDQEIMIAFMFIKNQIDLDTKKYEDIKKKRSEAGKKHKGNQYTNGTDWNKMEQMNQNGTNGSDNDNVNVNDNDNVNVLYNNINSSSNNKNNIYEFVEENFGRILTPLEIQKINEWEKQYSEEILKYALKIATLNNKKTFNYVNGILNNWKSAGYKTLQEIKDNEFEKEEKEQELFEYDWLNEEE